MLLCLWLAFFFVKEDDNKTKMTSKCFGGGLLLIKSDTVHQMALQTFFNALKTGGK